MCRYALALLCVLPLVPSARAGDDAAKQTVAYLQKLQTSTGGFLSMAPKPNIRLAPTLRATSAATRAIHYFGGEVSNKEAAIKYVESCYDPATGGFSDMPKGKPDVFTTAVGLMAVRELKMPRDKYADRAIKFMAEHAKTFEDIRIAVAGFEAVDGKSAKNEAWIMDMRKEQNADGTFGKGPGLARETGSRVVTILRLGGKVENTDRILKALNAGQRQNGGYGKAEDKIASDLETTYRVLRCYHMLKAQPAYAEGVRSFVAKCRNADGGYGVAPGQPSNVGGAYMAGSILHWLRK